MRRLALIVIVVAALPAAAAAGIGGRAPNWALQLRVSRWVALSSFAATVTGQTAGLNVRRGLAVTLVLDRRTRCVLRDAAGVVAVVRCASVRPALAQRGALTVNASGQFETGHLGAIGFRARTLALLPDGRPGPGENRTATAPPQEGVGRPAGAGLPVESRKMLALDRWWWSHPSRTGRARQ